MLLTELAAAPDQQQHRYAGRIREIGSYFEHCHPCQVQLVSKQPTLPALVDARQALSQRQRWHSLRRPIVAVIREGYVNLIPVLI